MNLSSLPFTRVSLKRRALGLLTIAALLLLAPESQAANSGWTELLDENLSQWDTYLSYQHKVGYNGAQPVDADGKTIAPIGYNKDATHVFSVEKIDGKLAVHVSGEFYGCVITKQEFENYRLKLKVKWGTKKWTPREDKLRDGGVLYHSIGQCGVDYWRAWALSQEFQIMEGHMGDYWSIASSAIDIRAYLPEGTMNSVADATQPFLPFGAKPSVSGFCLRHENAESKPGEWTEVELICFKGQSLHIINGKVVMVLRNSRYMKDGAAVPLTKGKIQLQSEAGELYYGDVKIQEIDQLPKEYEKLFAE